MLSCASAFLLHSGISSSSSRGSVLYTPTIWLPRVMVTWAGTSYLSQMAQTNWCCLQPQLIHWDAVIPPKSLRTDKMRHMILACTGNTCWNNLQRSSLPTHDEHTLGGTIASGIWLCSSLFLFVCLFCFVVHGLLCPAHQLEFQECKQTLLYI